MMCVDISIVLYRPNIQELIRTVDSLKLICDEFRAIHVLVSGSAALHSEVGGIFSDKIGFSQCKIYKRFDNLGFASGHNFLIEQAFLEGAKYCFILNPDMRISKGAIFNFIEKVESCEGNSLFGPSLERVDEPSGVGRPRVFDSNGIEWTSSARHFDRDMGLPWSIKEGSILDVQGLTGACLFVKKEVFDDLKRDSGYFFDDAFLAYREDAELGVRARLLGISSKMIQMNGFGHVRTVRGYERGRSLPDLLGVRNRFLILIRLGRARPGNFLGIMRDISVLFGVFFVERSSVAGVFSAYRMRRYIKYTSVIRAE